jgi:hypothetical protein
MPFCIEKNNTFPAGAMPCDFLETSYTNWLGSHNMFIQQNIFYLILPLLSVLPFGASFYADINGGSTKSICTRVKKNNYLIAKYIAVFVSGGAAAALPMFASFLACAALLPTMTPEASYAYTNIVSFDKWAWLLFSRPSLYILAYCGLAFLFAGLTACMALGITYFSSKSFLPMLFPFFVYIFESMLCELLGLDGFDVRMLLTPDATGNTTFTVAVTAVLFFAVSFIPYYFAGVKKDVL